MKKTNLHIAYYKGKKEDNPKSTWLDHLICAVTGHPYSHVELVLSFSSNNVGFCWSSSPRDGGSRYKYIDLDSGHWEVFKIVSDLPFKTVFHNTKSNNGKKYDWLGAIGAQYSFVPHLPWRLFCTEAIGKVLGIEDADRMSPGEMFYHFRDLHHIRVI